MDMLLAATAAFVVTHFASSTPLRGAAVRTLGERGWVVAYVLVAFATLGWMIWAYGRAPRGAPLWTPLRFAPLVAMPLASLLLACANLRNPAITRHPVMWAVILWAAAHIAARADARAIVFFGGLLLVAGLGTVLMDRKKRRKPDGPAFLARTSNVPFVAIAQGRNRLDLREIGALRPAVGLAIFAALLFLHPYLFGARPY